MKTNLNFWSYLTQFFLEREIFHTKLVEKIQNTSFSFRIFIRKLYRLLDNVEKYCKVTDNMAHAQCMLDTQVYKHTFRICKTFHFSTAKMIARTRFNVTTLYVRGLSL